VGVEKPPREEGRVAQALADGVIRPWWGPVQIPNWLRAVAIRKGWIDLRQRYPRGPVLARLTPAGLAVRDQTIAARVERAEKERMR
jgi:hypothetical protein